MKINFYIGIVLLLLVTYSCKKQETQITNSTDYNKYIELVDNKALQTAINDRHFWEKKLEKDPEQFPYLVQLAASYSQLFAITGAISNLIKAEAYLVKANEVTKFSNSGYLRILARNYISQHKFNEALQLLKTAEKLGEKLNDTQKMLFDVHLELGNYELAESYLEKIKNYKDFDFLIRTSKWHDHKGDLKSAIKYMENAMAISESSKNERLMQWSYTNIADFYGHDGQIAKSYNYYLKALQLNPMDAYAKKGIAWIVYSFERNPEEALRILNSVSANYQAPDYWLLKAEIYDFIEDSFSKSNCIEQFLKSVDNADYGVMYNMYKTAVILEELELKEVAITLALDEVSKRPTPETYDMLAWSYLKNNNPVKALQIVENYVVGKTFEPIALYHIAEVYMANNKQKEAHNLKKELLECGYELGPVTIEKVSSL